MTQKGGTWARGEEVESWVLDVSVPESSLTEVPHATLRILPPLPRQSTPLSVRGETMRDLGSSERERRPFVRKGVRGLGELLAPP